MVCMRWAKSYHSHLSLLGGSLQNAPYPTACAAAPRGSQGSHSYKKPFISILHNILSIAMFFAEILCSMRCLLFFQKRWIPYRCICRYVCNCLCACVEFSCLCMFLMRLVGIAGVWSAMACSVWCLLFCKPRANVQLFAQLCIHHPNR